MLMSCFSNNILVTIVDIFFGVGNYSPSICPQGGSIIRSEFLEFWPIGASAITIPSCSPDGVGILWSAHVMIKSQNCPNIDYSIVIEAIQSGKKPSNDGFHIPEHNHSVCRPRNSERNSHSLPIRCDTIHIHNPTDSVCLWLIRLCEHDFWVNTWYLNNLYLFMVAIVTALGT